MSIRCTYVTLSLILLSLYTQAQSSVALSTGISKDLNNKRPFYLVPVILYWQPFKHSGFFIESDYEIGLNRLTKADSYTANSQLPAHVVLTEAINPQSFSTGIGGSILLSTDKNNNSIVLKMSIGIRSDHYRVSYRNYDKVNYEVLNPDVGEDRRGLYVSVAGIYNFHQSGKDMFVMLRLQSPSSAKPGSSSNEYYALSYNSVAPLQLTFGYKLFYNKRK